MEIGGIDPERLVFVDEMGTHTSLAPLYGYAPIGERAFVEVPRNRGKNTTLPTSMTTGGMGAFYGRGRSDHLQSVCGLLPVRRTL